ncbi:MAG TPA: hypothetical protein VLV54_15860, partial [Thermoanaerobaculia bacterium]|nr:hypothetical protein [Thermoanaerobaculia bacterium]
FLHVSDEAPLYIDRLGELHSGATQDFIRGDRVKAREEYIVAEAWRKHSVPLRDLADHAPINYVYALRHQVP